jgi:hypothetical protein
MKNGERAMHCGSCLCQGVTFTVSGELPPIQVCHCGQCRRAQGTPFVTNIPVNEAQLNWLSGQDLIQRYESSPGKWRCFCKTCGSPLFSQRTSLPGVLRLRAGTLEGQVNTRVGLHIYEASKANWWSAEDDAQAPRFAEMPPAA